MRSRRTSEGDVTNQGGDGDGGVNNDDMGQVGELTNAADGGEGRCVLFNSQRASPPGYKTLSNFYGGVGILFTAEKFRNEGGVSAGESSTNSLFFYINFPLS